MAALLTAEIAGDFVELVLCHLTREFPNKPSHELVSPGDIKGPRALHPAFYGSYDWHSCVHGYWLLLYLIQRFPDLRQASRIIDVVDDHFTVPKLAMELAYVEMPHNRSFERPYGWAWLLKLASQVEVSQLPGAKVWRDALAPLAAAFVARLEEYLPKATYPIRTGTHSNTAFALAFALDFARTIGHHTLADLVTKTARRWYLADVACQAWEPCGDEFLSPITDGG